MKSYQAIAQIVQMIATQTVLMMTRELLRLEEEQSIQRQRKVQAAVQTRNQTQTIKEHFTKKDIKKELEQSSFFKG